MIEKEELSTHREEIVNSKDTTSLKFEFFTFMGALPVCKFGSKSKEDDQGLVDNLDIGSDATSVVDIVFED